MSASEWLSRPVKMLHDKDLGTPSAPPVVASEPQPKPEELSLSHPSSGVLFPGTSGTVPPTSAPSDPVVGGPVQLTCVSGDAWHILQKEPDGRLMTYRLRLVSRHQLVEVQNADEHPPADQTWSSAPQDALDQPSVGPTGKPVADRNQASTSVQPAAQQVPFSQRHARKAYNKGWSDWSKASR